MSKKHWRPEHAIRPTLLVGVGDWGARVTTSFVEQLSRRLDRIPVVRTVALVGERRETGKPDNADSGEQPGTPVDLSLVDAHIRPPSAEPGGGDGGETWDTAFVRQLDHIRRLDLVQATRHAGWTIASGQRSGIVLAAAMEEMRVDADVASVVRLLDELDATSFNYRPALSGLFLRPSDSTGGPPLDPDLVSHFDEGFYLLDQVNVDGLLLDSAERQADLVALWLVLWLTTSLYVALDHVPPPGEGIVGYSALGLAQCSFPSEALMAHLLDRWQRDVLDRLLADPGGSRQPPGRPGSVAPFLEHIEEQTAWKTGEAPRFRVSGEVWATPPLDRVTVLRREIDAAVAAERARLGTLEAWGEETLEDAETEALQAATASILDAPQGLAEAGRFLEALAAEARRQVCRREQEANRCHCRADELNGLAEEAGRALDDLTACFPPLRPRVVWGVLLRPWRWLPLFLRYREIGRRAGVYLGYHQSRWLLDVEACEKQRQAVFYAHLAEIAQAEREAVEAMRAQLEQLRGGLADEKTVSEDLRRALEAAALPAGLAEHFYRRAVPPNAIGTALNGFLAIYGPLSRWVREGCHPADLRERLVEHGHERFAFLSEIRLDELLARTHSGAELRRRLTTLIETAAPWWAGDVHALSARERSRIRRLALLGLPDADHSLLTDLLPERPLSCFSTGDRRQIVAIQVIQNLGFQGIDKDAGGDL